MKISNTADRLKEIMREQDLKQVDILAKALPYCQKYDLKLTKVDLSQYISGKVEPGQAKLFILSNALNVNEAWLMGYDVSPRRTDFIITNHKNIDDEILYAISIIASYSGYDFEFFANQFQIKNNDVIVKLSPNEVRDYAYASIEQIKYVTNTIITNKLNDNITSIYEDNLIAKAAHERTDIEVTEEMRKHDDDIMNNDDFWK